MATFRAVVDLSWSGMGSPGVNVWHFRQDGEPLNTSVQEVIDALQTFYTSCLGLYSNDAVISMPNEVIKDPYGSPEYEAVEGWSTTGQGGGAKAPAATALTVTWRTTSATRSGRGRTFLSPITAAAVEGDGTVLGTQLNAVRNAADTLVSTSKDWNQAALGVYSQADGLFRDFQSANVRDTFAVLRSRRD